MGDIKIKRKDLPRSPGGKSSFVLTNPPKGLRQAEMPLGILRYEDALNLGASKKGTKNPFTTAERLAHDKTVKEFLNNHGYTAESYIANLPRHKQLKIDAQRVKDKKKRRKILAALAALSSAAIVGLSYKKYIKKHP